MSDRGWIPALAIFFAGLIFAQAVTPAERRRFEEIRARHDLGEIVSAEDRRFASAMARMQQTAAAQQNVAYAQTYPARTSTGLVALPDLGEAR